MIDATPAGVAVEANACDLVASDGHVYGEITQYIDHGSQNNVDGEDLGDEECDVPVVNSVLPDENNEGQNSTIPDDSNRHYPPGFHAIVRHGGSLLRGREEPWLKIINLKSDPIEVSKSRIGKYTQKLNLINQENKMKVDEERCLKKEAQQDGKIDAAKNNNEEINYLTRIKNEEEKLKELEKELDGLINEHYEPMCELAKELQQFRDDTLANRNSVPVFVLYNEEKNAITVFRPSPDSPSTASLSESKKPYMLLCLADGTRHLKTGEIMTVIRKHFDDLPKILRKANKRNTMEWIDISNKTVKELSLCRGSPGIYILNDESSTNCKGLETIFPHWRFF